MDILKHLVGSLVYHTISGLLMKLVPICNYLISTLGFKSCENHGILVKAIMVHLLVWPFTCITRLKSRQQQLNSSHFFCYSDCSKIDIVWGLK